MKKIIYFTLFMLIFLFLIFLFFKEGYLRFNYPSSKKYPVRGIDISHHQKRINWDELKKENIKFIIIKATEGADFIDPRFKENWENSINNNYQTGAYHFYRFCKTGKEQAENFIKTVPYSDKSLPPIIDLEYGGNCATKKTKETIKKEIHDYLEIVKNYYGKKPIIYATQSFYNDFIEGDYLNYDIWIRDIYSEPKLENERIWLLWQYANRGHLKGIDGFVDLNVFNGSNEEYTKFLNKK